MASMIRVEHMTVAEEDGGCQETVGLCGLEFDELEACCGCGGLEDKWLCKGCPLLVEDG